jgi:hypothetical protein
VPEIRQLHRFDRNSIPGNLIASKPIVLRVHRHFFLPPLSARIRGVWAGLIVLIEIAGARAVYAQAPAGRPDFSGTWAFDTYLSDNPEQIARALRLDTGQPGDEALVGRGTGRGGVGGGAGRTGRGRLGGEERGRAEEADQMSAEDRKKVTELTNAVQFASPTLTITQAESTITVAGDRGATQTILTSGKAEKYTLESGTVERVARWEGPTLVIAYDVGHAGTLTYAYALVPTTKQLLIRVNFERVRGEPGPFEIKLVYNRAGARQP